MREVLKKYEQWNTENDCVVLWDIDDTIGTYFYRGANDKEFYIRPAMQVLIPYLTRKYPNVENGILTNRVIVSSTESFGKYQEFLSQNKFFNEKFVFSSRLNNDIQTREVAAKLRDFYSEVDADLVGRIDNDTANKYITIENIAEEHPANTFKIIDNNAIAAIKGTDGLDAEQFWIQG